MLSWPGSWTCRRRIQRLLIEMPPQDGIEALVADRAGEQSPFGGGFHTCGGIALSQADDAEARAITHLGMRERFQDFLHHFGGVRHPRCGPTAIMREGGQSKCARWEAGTMLGVGHCRVRLVSRTWEATRWPL